MTAKFIYIKGNTVYLLNGIPEGEASPERSTERSRRSPAERVEPDLVGASYAAMHRANVAFDAANKPVGFRAHWALADVYQAV